MEIPNKRLPSLEEHENPSKKQKIAENLVVQRSKGAILKISNNLLRRIFNYLSEKDFYRTIPLICKLYSKIVQNCYRLRTVITISNREINFKKLNHFSNFSRIKSIKIEFFTDREITRESLQCYFNFYDKVNKSKLKNIKFKAHHKGTENNYFKELIYEVLVHYPSLVSTFIEKNYEDFFQKIAGSLKLNIYL